MVVYDDEFSRHTAGRILKRLGASCVIEASDGDEALSRVTRLAAPLDIILCDLKMPRVNGIETLRSLAARDISALIVLVSGADSRVLRSARHLAADFGIGHVRTICKPLTVEKLRETLEANRGLCQAATAEACIAAEPPIFTVEDIRRGLKAGEFDAHFQPKMVLTSRRVVGAEALVRWQRPDLAVLAPGHFLPAVLAAGLLDELTEIVLRRAAAACAGWRRDGHELTVSVNLHVSSLVERDLPRRLEGIANRSGLAADQMILEITEDGWLRQAGAREVLTRLRLQGFGLSIDDFGTGYSTLQQLLEAPFNELKIDRSFVRSAPFDDEAAAALASSITLAHRLGLAVVGEGIENVAQWRFLEQAGCGIGQGYAIGRPMPAGDFTVWLAQWARDRAADTSAGDRLIP